MIIILLLVVLTAVLLGLYFLFSAGVLLWACWDEVKGFFKRRRRWK